ncbi:MAG: transcriptional regulator CynR [Gammaproteobacteria bacterium]|nr:transcriptional regulator CynR [Gammaproteobacteria bacterium]
MELRHLRYFLAVADNLSFTRAADQLHVTQPTLSHQVKQLEKEINSVLFDRVGRRVHLTPSGEIFHEYAQKALKEINSATAAIAELEGLRHGALTIGVFESFSTSLLPPLLADFCDLHPGVHVTMRQLPSGQLEEQLDKGNLNLGIAYSPPATDKIVAEKLFDEPLVLVVGTKHRLARRKTFHIAELAGEPLTLLTAEFPSRRLLESCLASVRAKPRIALEINSIQATLATVRHTKLATVLTERMAMTVPGLHCIELVPTVNRTAAVFWRQGAYRTIAARVMADLIKKAYIGPAKPRPKMKTDSRKGLV